MRRAASLLAVVLAAPALAQQPELGPVIEEVVAVVGDRVVTRSDLELEARVVLVDNGGVEAAFGAIDAETMGSVLDWLLNQLLIHAEAERLQVFEVSADEVAREVERFRRRFGDPTAWRHFLATQDVGLERIASIFRRNLRVRRYLESRVKLTVRVGAEEVEAFYEENRSRFEGRPLSAVEDVIRGYLFKQRYERTVRTLVKELRERADVRVLVEPGARAAVPPPQPVEGPEE